jgi:hypothetical protein
MNDFFSQLAERLRNENDLSDITWALCRSNSYFQKIFIDYCFDNKIESETDSIEREFSEGNSRPDFLITDDKENRYILEVKIYDKNTHDEYKKQFKKDTRAFIANYNFLDKKGVYGVVRTWHEFIDHLEKECKGLNNPSIMGYIKYLKSVTNYFKGENMDLSKLNSLHTFVMIIKEIIESDNKKTKKIFQPDEGWIAFDVKFKQRNQNIHFQFGLGFWDKEPFVLIQFSKDTAQSIKDKLLNTKKRGNYYGIPKRVYTSAGNDAGWIDVTLKNDKFKKLCDAKIAVKEQKEILKKFYEETMKIIS